MQLSGTLDRPPASEMNRALLTVFFFALHTLSCLAVPFFTERKLVTFETAPPMPAPVRLVLSSRLPVRVILRVQGFQTEPVTFLLREVPKHGSIWMAPQVSGEWAEVTYTPPQDRSIASDSFKFAVSNSKSTSSESTAIIQFQDVGPRLDFPPSMEFGKLRVGQSFQRSIEIKNTGDLAAAGSISIVGPWHLNPPGKEYLIEPGNSLTFQLVFQPQAAGSFEGSLHLSSSPAQSVYLSGKAEDWIDAWPDPLVLRTEADQTRQANLNLINPTEKPTSIRLESFPAIEHERSISLKPGEQTTLPVVFRRQSPVENSGKLVLTSEDGRERVLLWRTQSMPPALGGLDGIESLVIPRTGKTVRVWNEGGRPGRWSLQASAPFKLQGPDKTSTNELEVILAPGEARELLLIPESKATTTKGTFKVASVRHQMFPATVLKTIELSTTLTRLPQRTAYARPLPEPEAASKSFAEAMRRPPSRAEFPDPPKAGAYTPPAILPKSPSKGPPSEDVKASTADAMRRLNAAFLPAVFLNGLSVSDITHNSVKFSFEPPKGLGDQPITVKRQTLELNENGQIQARWDDVKSVLQSKDASGKIVLSIAGLPSASSTQLRLLGPPMENGRRAALHESTVYTLPAPGLLSPSRPWIWLSIVPMMAFYLSRRNGLHIGRRRR